LNLKFPVIERKNLALTIETLPEKRLYAVDLRDCLKNMDRKDKNKNPEKDFDT
jgi:hypothetical protein